jgi:acetoin utilization protein AcuB
VRADASAWLACALRSAKPVGVTMRAADIMTKTVFSVSPELALPDAWATMQQLRVRHLPVLQRGRLVGLLSERDVLLHAMTTPEGRVIVVHGVVGAVMTPAPRVCSPSTPVGAVAQTLINHKIHALPVVDDGDHDQLVGIVTSTDLFWLLVDDGKPQPAIEIRVPVATADGAAAGA